MDGLAWETCEVVGHRVRHGLYGSRYRFVADAVGPKGRYVAAESRRSFNLMDGFLISKDDATDLEDPLTRGGGASNALDDLASRLVAQGWEPGEGRGPHWYSLRFRRRLAPTPARGAAGVKSVPVAYALWLGLGLLGGHRYYLGRTRSAVLQTLTIAGAGVWWLADLLLLPGLLREANGGR